MKATALVALLLAPFILSFWLRPSKPAAPTFPCVDVREALEATREQLLAGPWVDAPERAQLDELDHLIDHVNARCPA